MRGRFCSGGVLVGLAGMALALCGCTSNEFTTPNNQQSRAAVQQSAPVVLNALPMADPAYSLVGGLLDQIVAPAAMSSGRSLLAAAVPGCEPAFDLGNGITGTCALSNSISDPDNLIDTATLTFEGTQQIDGLATTVEGTLTAQVPAEQPTSGTKYVVTFGAAVANTRWSASWTFSHSTIVTATSPLTDLAPLLTMDIIPTTGSHGVATLSVTSAFKTFFVQTAGLNVSYLLGLSGASGSVSVQGREFATLSFTSECVTIHYVDASLADETICRQ
jgi:hypothetical protein